MTTKELGIKVKGEDQASSVLDSISKMALALFSKRALDATVASIKLGAASLAARDRLIAMAGGTQRANSMMAALNTGADNTIGRLNATTLATSLLEQGLVSSAGEMELAGAMISKLGRQTWSTERRVDSLTMMLANQSRRRLDDFGLSVANVTARQKELQAQGYSTERAFKAAVFEEAGKKLGILGDMSDTGAVQVAQLNANLETLKQTAGEGVTQITLESGALEWLTAKAAELTVTLDKLFTLMAAGSRWWSALFKSQGDLAVANEAYNTSLLEQLEIIPKVARAMDGYGSNLDETARAAKELADAEEKAAKARARLDTKLHDMNRQRFLQERQWSRQLEDFYKNRERAAESHQQRLAEIIASGQKTAADLAQEWYDQRIRALNEAMARELEALTAAQEQRNWNKTLEGMEEDHQKRMAAIRENARETEQQREDRQHQERLAAIRREQEAARAALSERQSAEEAALRRKYGHGDDPASQREALEKEHRRRMKGLYSKTARDRERARYEAALKELEYQDELDKMRKRHADEQKALEDRERKEEAHAEERHAARLKAIQEAAIRAALEAEKERYRNQVAEAKARRTQRQQDAAARKAIEDNYEQLRKEAAEALAARMAEIQQQEIQRRINAENLAYAREQEDQARHFQRMKEDRDSWFNEWEYALNKVMQDLLAVISGGGGYNLPEPSPDGGSVFSNPGGGPLFSKPGMSLKAPQTAPQEPGVFINITNHFGTDSVRSDQDIIRIGNEQERALRLRGVRTV